MNTLAYSQACGTGWFDGLVRGVGDMRENFDSGANAGMGRV